MTDTEAGRALLASTRPDRISSIWLTVEGIEEAIDAIEAETRRATVELALSTFDAEWRDMDGKYGSPRPKWALAKIRAAIAAILDAEADR